MKLEIWLINNLLLIIISAIFLVSLYLALIKPLRKNSSGQSDYQKFKAKNPHKNLINFLWRKKYRESLWVIGTVGSALIIFTDNLTKNLDVGADEELTALLLFITALTIFWSTRETYDLKNIAQKDVREARTSQMNEFLPVLVPHPRGTIREGEIMLNISNVGKGIAKDINIWIEGITVKENFTIPANNTTGVHIRNNENIKLKSQEEDRETFSMELRYRDVSERTIRTQGLIFERDSQRRSQFSLDANIWKFKIE
jgi:hypothetical protein